MNVIDCKFHINSYWCYPINYAKCIPCIPLAKHSQKISSLVRFIDNGSLYVSSNANSVYRLVLKFFFRFDAVVRLTLKSKWKIPAHVSCQHCFELLFRMKRYYMVFYLWWMNDIYKLKRHRGQTPNILATKTTKM